MMKKITELKAFVHQPIGKKEFFKKCLIAEVVLNILMSIFESMYNFARATHHSGFLPYAVVLTVAIFSLRFYEYAVTARRARDIGVTPWIALLLIPLEATLTMHAVTVALLILAFIPSKSQNTQ